MALEFPLFMHHIKHSRTQLRLSPKQRQYYCAPTEPQLQYYAHLDLAQDAAIRERAGDMRLQLQLVVRRVHRGRAHLPAMNGRDLSQN